MTGKTFAVYYWKDIKHWLSGKDPRIEYSWYHPNPVNHIESVEGGYEDFRNFLTIIEKLAKWE